MNKHNRAYILQPVEAEKKSFQSARRWSDYVRLRAAAPLLVKSDAILPAAAFTSAIASSMVCACIFVASPPDFLQHNRLCYGQTAVPSGVRANVHVGGPSVQG
jgi:hypothetical protein